MVYKNNLKIHNTLTREKEIFTPIKPNQVGIYVCGNTVYDFSHVGNARVFVFFDVVVRYLRALGFAVKYVRNITDIDDKIIKRANELGEDVKILTERFTNALHEDLASLGNLPPDLEPKVTDNMAHIIAMIQTLVEKGFAYPIANGDVYFDINKFQQYGELAHQDLEKLKAGARIEISGLKRDPLDFVLWKNAKPNEPSWLSPWGEGRPGWHIECSAMAKEYLSEHFDIHGGGADLQFPHHQNELAQSEAASGCKFVNYWMHVGFVQVDNTKMSKSLGNFFTVREVLKHYNWEVLRFFILASHYRSPLNYSAENLDNAKNALIRFYTALKDLNKINEKEARSNSFTEDFFAAMNDDFNTPKAISVLFDLARHINNCKKEQNFNEASLYANDLLSLSSYLGILQQDPELFLRGDINTEDLEAQIQKAIELRNDARNNKNWAEADRIRNEMLAKGIVLEDSLNGTMWKKL